MAAWPAVGWESLPWVPRREGASRTAQRTHQGPYGACVPLAIADRRIELEPDTLSSASDAAAEIARFDGTLSGELAPFAVMLLRSESAASSEIENLSASARAIAEVQLGVRNDGNAAGIVANVAAMTAAIALADDLSSGSILAMHRALMEPTWPEIAGQFRDEPVWIGGSGVGPHHARYVAPAAERVPGAVGDLVAFMARDDIPALTHAAVAHAQFETIHPFADGNGRTGRALVHAMLRGKQLTRSVTVPLSAGLLAHTDRYFAALESYRDGHLEPIVEAFSEAAYLAIDKGRTLVDDLHAVRESWDLALTARQHSAAWRSLDLLIRQPVINAGTLAAHLDVDVANVYRTFEALESAGILVASGGQRHRSWRAPAVLDALDNFAKRGQRREYVGPWVPGAGADLTPEIPKPDAPCL